MFVNKTKSYTVNTKFLVFSFKLNTSGVVFYFWPIIKCRKKDKRYRKTKTILEDLSYI